MQIVAIVLLLVFGTTAFADVTPHDSEFVYFAGDFSGASASLAGRGLVLTGTTASRPWASNGVEIIWKAARDHTDPRGGRHLFYRQSALVGRHVAEITGSEVGLHYSPSGALTSIAGGQVTTLQISNQVRTSAADAAVAAAATLRAVPGFMRSNEKLSAHERGERAAATRLKVVRRDGASVLAWHTVAFDDRDTEYEVVVDAETGRVLAYYNFIRESDCSPTTPLQLVTAVTVPVRPDTPSRTLEANVASRSGGYTHEGHHQTSYAMTAYQQTNNLNFMCDDAVSDSYTVVPLTTDANGQVSYAPTSNGTGTTWRGEVAGDGLHFTRATMTAFSTLGRNGWDGLGAPAHVVVESTIIAGAGRAFFRHNNTNVRAPQTSVMGITPGSPAVYAAAASLDVIAHEWGHGVIYTSANFPCTSTDPDSVGCQMHEGFADVIGHTAEKLTQNSGYAVEQSSDWKVHEDSVPGEVSETSEYHRGALDDGTAGHSYVGTTVDHYIHREDEPVETQAHMRGNMLSMVLRLMTEGGTNPICARIPSAEGCTVSVTAIGLTKATQIMFDALQFYAPSNVTWETLPTYVNQAAFDRYATCDAWPSYSAGAEQKAVNDAFTNIGYPRTTDFLNCN